MIAHHYFPVTNNIGDFFVRDGIRRLFSDAAADAEFVDIPVNGPRNADCLYGLRGENLDRSNREADLIIVGGSNLYECRRSGAWGVVTDSASIRQVRRPVVLIGLGAGSGYRSTVRQCSGRSREEILLLNELAVGSSVRDARTLEYVRALGVAKAVLTGCPATFVHDRPFEFRDSDSVAVALPSVRFRKHRLVFFRLMRAIRKYIAQCRREGLRVVISCHDPRDLDLVDRFTSEAVEILHSDNPQDYYELYGKARLVVGFRLHACIACLSLGVPFIPISLDLRAVGFAETYNAADWLIDGTKSGLLAALKHRHRAIIERRRESFENLVRGREKFRQVMREFVSNCLSEI